MHHARECSPRFFCSRFWADRPGLYGGPGPRTGRPHSSRPFNRFRIAYPRRASQRGDWGVMYHSLENKAALVTTTFADAIAVAERGPDGHLSSRVTDLAGNEVARFKVHRVDAESDTLELTLPGQSARHAARRSGLRPTLDWSNQQAYSFWKDRNALDSLEWQDTLMRPVGARKRDVRNEALRIDTEWLGGDSASVIRKIGTHTSQVTKRKATGVVFISSFKSDGIEVGSSQWWPEEQAFAWSFPGLTEGYIDAARLQASGGWPFTPDMAWLNTQSLALYELHTTLAAKGRVSQKQGGWLHTIGAFIAPALLANEPGCDYLHWLDQTIFRAVLRQSRRLLRKGGSGLRGEQLVEVLVELAVHSVQHVDGFLLQDGCGWSCLLPFSVELPSSFSVSLPLSRCRRWVAGGWTRGRASCVRPSRCSR